MTIGGMALAVALYVGAAGNPLAMDKAAHFGAGYVVADVAKESGWPCPTCWGVAAGVVKEGFDGARGRWDWRDLGATAAGSGFQLTINW